MKKNYFKKSLSLIMTVLMLMSCWVFFPGMIPEAEAAATDATSEYNKSLVNSLSAINTPVTTMTGSFEGDTQYVTNDYYSQVYKNVLHTSQVTLSSTPAAQWKPDKWKDSNPADRIAIWHPTTVLLYDGVTTPEFGVVLEVDAADSIRIRSRSAYIYSGANGLKFKQNWKGYVTGRLEHMFLMFNSGATDHISSDGTAISGLEFNTASGGWYFLANDLQFTGSMGNTEYLRTINPTYGYIGMQASGDSWHTLTGSSAHSIYVINYNPVKAATNQVNTWLQEIKNNPGKYSTACVKSFIDLYNKMVAAHPNKFASSTVCDPNGYNTAATAAMTAYNSFELVERKQDITFENMFSISDWYNSASSGYNANYGEVIVENDSTIKIYKSISGGELTTGSSYPNAHNATMYSMPVTAGKEYTVSFNITSSANGTIAPEVFLFWFDVNGNPVNNTDGTNTFNNKGFSGNGYHEVTFTAPATATMCQIRFDNDCSDTGSTLRFNNIAVYPAERGEEYGIADWTNRPCTKAYANNVALGTTLDVPARKGYNFNGWYLDSNTNGAKDDGEEVTDATGTVVAGFAVGDHYNLYADWVPMTMDVGYDNLFSLSKWAQTDSPKPSDSTRGDVVYDLDAGTITVNTTQDGEVYTNYGTAANHYQMAVEPNTKYIFKADMNLDAGTKGQMFVFFYDANGNGLTGANNGAITNPHIGIYPTSNGTQSITFTTPANCTQMAIRVGATDVGTTATYSNIGFFKKADYDAYVNGYTEIREPFKFGTAVNLMNPARDGYRFDGWFTADNTKITDTANLSESTTVYAHWTKLWTVTFLGGDNNTIKTVAVADGSVLSSDQYPLAPDKKSDDNYSYTFVSWDYDSSAVISDITISPTYTPTAHTRFTYGTVAQKAATCTQNATVAKYCADCGHEFGYVVFDGDLIAYPQYAALGHNFDGQPAVQGSDDGNGQHLVRCARYSTCGAEKYVDHVWSEIGTEGANCITPGTINWKCPCGATNATVGETAPNVHDNTELVGVKAPTCLEDGYTGDTRCTDCYTIIEYGKTDPKLGHSFTNYVYNNDAECESDGTETAKCDRCDITDTRTKTGSALEHNWTETEKYPKTEANCTDNAVYYKECSLCGISSESKTDATWEKANTAWGHDYTGAIVRDNKDGTHSYLCASGCNTYGYDGVEDAATGCTYGEWDTTDAAEHKKTCEECGYVYTQAHDWSKWDTADGATAEAPAQQTRSCKICYKVETKDCTYTSTHEDATCTSPEITTYSCSDCGHGYTVIGNPATGHKYTGDYKYDAATDTHQQLCANGCGTYGVGTEKDKTEACSWTYANKEDGKHTASCVCGNSQEEACTGGQATCTAPATCEKCLTAYGSTAPHSFTGTPVVLEGDKHAYRCEYCDGDTIYGVGENQGYTEACSGGTATCTAKAVCTVCGDTHGEINANNHKWSDPVNVDGTETHKSTCQYDSNHTKTGDCVCSSPAVLAPDCETAGYQLNTCDDCGHGWQTDPKDALGHDWSAWISNGDGTHTRTCERAGCGYNTENHGTAKTETVDCTETNATYVVTDPTCLDEGYTTYTCNDCGYEWVDDYTDATGHSYDKKTKKTDAVYKRSDKDCTTALTYWYVCDNCDVSAGTEKDKYEIEADLYWVAEEPANHKFDKKDTDDKYLKTEATCTESAVYYYSCSVCGATSEGTANEKTFTTGTPLGHAWENTEKYLKSEADCVNNEVYYTECSRCHISSEGETNATWTKENTMTGHDFDHDNDDVIGNEGDAGYVAKKDPTCSEKGMLEHYTCEVCGKMYADEDATEQIFKVEVEAKGHDWKSVAYKAPTCEEDGHSEHKACSVCGEKNSAYEVREKTGHNFTGAYTYDPIYNYHSRYCVNENCLADGEKAFGIGNEKYSVELDGIDYVIKGGEECDFDSFTTATDENGLHSHKLECVCGNAQSFVIDAADITTEVVAPTCTDAGYTLNTCQKDGCGDTWKTDIVEKLGHDLSGTATSNGNGTHSVKCKREGCDYSEASQKCSTQTPSTTCGQKNVCDICGGEFGEKIAHVFTNYVYNNDATCTADGTKTAECDNCDINATDTVTATGTKLGHDMSVHGYVVPEKLKDKLEEDGVVIAEPTCGEEGRSISYCSRCDHYVTKVVPKNKDAHDMPEEWTKVGGNCASGVTYVRACTVCGKKESKTENIPHNWKAIVIEEAGCTVNGYINFECSVCGFTATLDDTVEGWPSFNGVDYSDKNIVATGKHVWQTEAPADEDYMMIDGVVVFVEEYPTYNTTGRGYKKCTICNAVEKVTIAAYGNAPEDHKHPELGINDNSTLKYVAEVKPTCNVGGHKGYYECTRCSYSQYNIDHDSFYIPALGHTAPNSKGKCDRCKTTLEEDTNSRNCGCICHKDSGFMKFIYKILRFFWKLFGMNKTCACGVAHY